ncbi:uncharacterized protein LOC124271307 [Haliotis rubra]|uniref:uncharacterized protein LOC124271307 n=1 Tax=Haliotis rubra TaxID=36100 RepID=UPI001EE54799|nr:uncharacterized protein LOC124271307 [Haliotis rubra]
MASVEVARHFGRPKLSCRILFKSWFQTEESQCGHDRQQADCNVIGSATPEDQPSPSAEMTSPVRSLEEAPGISEDVMGGEGVQMATPGLRQVPDSGTSCGPHRRGWGHNMVFTQCGHDRQQTHRNVMGSATSEDQPSPSAEMTCPMRSLEEAPGISEDVMGSEGVQMATPGLRQVPDSGTCCGPHRRGYNMIFSQPPGVSSALCISNLGEFAPVNIADTNTIDDGDVSSSHPGILDLMNLLLGFGVQSKPVPYKPRRDRHVCTGEVFCKNLFLKDRRGHFYLVICDEQNDLDLKRLRLKLKAYRNFSFGSQDEMAAILHVSAGGLTPFALMHGSARDVRVVMTKDLTTDKEALLNFHPLDANLTLPVRLTHLIKFLDHFRFQLDIVDMSC